MDLSTALRLSQSPRLALVGAGGKTTALFLLARQLQQDAHSSPSTVLVSASTHLAVQQIPLADHHFIIESSKDLEAVGVGLPTGVVLCIGLPAEPERMAGLSPALLARLCDLADVQGYPLLLEGDGSRRRPLKAPAAHEPVIPEWIDTVVVVAGLSGLGQPLGAEYVHRPELFAALSGIALSEPVTVEGLARVLAHPSGGLKGIPPAARRVALLNQADNAARQAAAHHLGGELLGAYQAVLVAALAPPGGMNTSTGVLAVHEPVAAVILAAGASRRLGQPKQVLLWRGEPLVRHVARTALSAGLSPVVVVTGFAAEHVQAAVQDLPVVLVENPAWQTGQSASLIAGLDALPTETGAALFMLADQPQVPPGLVRGLVELHAQSLSPLVAPLVDGRRGNPVLFDRATFADLRSLSGDVGGRALFSRYPVAWLPWHDSTLALDVDTAEDYARLLEMERGIGG
jgi:molybdenum cofactor cytidylyltransferase